MKTPRNAPCPCGSGKKYKKCCLTKEQEQARQEALEGKQASEAEAETSESVELAFLKSMGVDASELANMSEEQSAKLMASLLEDPEKMAELEAFLENNPELLDEADALAESMEPQLFNLFVGERAQDLFSEQEMLPWLLRLAELLNERDQQEAIDAAGEEDFEEAFMFELYSDVAREICLEMTQERLGQLREALLQLQKANSKDPGVFEPLSYALTHIPVNDEALEESRVLSILTISCLRSHFYDFVEEQRDDENKE